MAEALTGARVFTGDTILDGHAVVVDAGLVLAVLPEAELPAGIARRELAGGLLAPGFIDTQVNGGGGVLFNEHPDVDGIRAIAAAHRRFGTTGMLPTLISDTRARMGHAVAAVRQAMERGVPGILGVHLEGPFLNTERKGVHLAERLVRIEEADLALLTSLKLGRTLVTLAPECVPAAYIRHLAGAGVIVAAGHTAGSYEEIRTGLISGVTGFTHLFNAMSALGNRAPGAVGAALDDAHSWCGLIVDGFHVHPTALRIALAAKPRGKLFLVTDAMSTTGSGIEQFELLGRTVYRRDGRLLTPDGTLAGSDLDMAAAVRNTVTLLGLPLEEALRMASAYPAAFLGLDRSHGRIAPGYCADLVLLDPALTVVETWIGGIAEAVEPIHGI